MNKKISENNILKWLVYLYGVFVLVYISLSLKLFESFPEDNGAYNDVYSTLIYFFSTLLLFIIGYGIFKRRQWAWKAILAILFILPLFKIQYIILWGFNSINTTALFLKTSLLVITLVFFYNNHVRGFFNTGKALKTKRWQYIVSYSCVALILLNPIIIAVYLKNINVEPLYIEKPLHMELPIIAEEEKRGYRKARLPGVEMMVPHDYLVWKIREAEDGWDLSLRSAEDKITGYVRFGNVYPSNGLLGLSNHGIKNGYESEEFLFENNWNPIAIIVRSANLTFQIAKIEIDGNRGFLKRWERTSHFITEFTLYKNDGEHGGDGTVLYNKDKFTPHEALKIASSFRFIEDDRPSDYYYKKGLNYYKNGKTIDAQYAFVMAYALKAENSPYAYMLAKTSLINGYYDADWIKGLLNEIDKSSEKYEDAQHLLSQIKEESDI